MIQYKNDKSFLCILNLINKYLKNFFKLINPLTFISNINNQPSCYFNNKDYFDNMYELGKYNKLKISHEVDFGVYLVDDKENEILLPLKQVPDNAKVGDELELFVYNDSEDRPIATTKHPKGCVGDIVALEVVDVNKSLGAFLDWGLNKDLLLPFKHQKRNATPRISSKILVKILYDKISDRLIASTRIMSIYDPSSGTIKIGDKIELKVVEPHERGYTIIVNNLYQGMLFSSDVFESLSIGDQKTGYIKNIRIDGKLDVTLKMTGVKAIKDDKQLILTKFNEHNTNYLPYNSKSDANNIQKEFNLSKKAFKKAIGGLYKERKIEITNDGIKLLINL